MYQLIACDLDETLIRLDRTISKEDADAIKALKKYNVKFVPATGRGYATVDGTLEELGLLDEAGQYVLSYNGGAITENKNHRLLAFEGIDYDLANELWQRGTAYDVCVHVYTKDMVYAWNLVQEEIDYLAGRMPIEEVDWKDLSPLKGQEIVKVLYMNTDYSYLKKIEKDLSDITGDIDVSFSSNRYIEFNHKGVNKGEGLKKLAKILNISLSDCIAIGDNFNDLPMITAAGLGVGVANTVEAMKPECDYITVGTCDQNAVAEVIHKFIMNDWKQ